MSCEKYCLAILCLLVSVSCIHCAVPLTPFVKNEKSYESIFGKLTASDALISGYYETISEILGKFIQSQVSYEELNKFGQGLDQLFLFRFLQKGYEDEISNQKVDSSSIPDSLNVPDFHDSSSGFDFKDLVVHSFPVYKKGAKPLAQHDGLGSASEYKISIDCYSDTFILTGSVYIAGGKYFFLSRVSNPKYAVEVRMNRNPEEVLFAKRSLSYDKEEYIHTYDSSYDNATYINSILSETIANNLLPHVLQELSQSNAEDLKNQALRLEKSYLQKVDELILIGLTKSALAYYKGYLQANNKSDEFTATDLGYGVSNPGAPLQFSSRFQDIKLKGFLNYEGEPKFVYSNTSISDGGRLFNLSQGIQFSYAEQGEKTAFVSFYSSDARHDRQYYKQFKVQIITIICEYLAELNKKPAKVYRNNKVFFNGLGCITRIAVYGGTESSFYDNAVNHLGNDIVRSLHSVIEGAKVSA